VKTEVTIERSFLLLHMQLVRKESHCINEDRK